LCGLKETEIKRKKCDWGRSDLKTTGKDGFLCPFFRHIVAFSMREIVVLYLPQ